VELGENCQFSAGKTLSPLSLPTIPCLLRVLGRTDLFRRKVEVIEPTADELIWPNYFIEIGEIIKVFAD